MSEQETLPVINYPPAPWIPRFPAYDEAMEGIDKRLKHLEKSSLQTQYIIGFYAKATSEGCFGPDKSLDEMAIKLGMSRSILYERKRLAEVFTPETVMDMCLADVMVTTAIKLSTVDDDEVRQNMMDKALARKLNSSNFEHTLARCMASNKRIAGINKELEEGEKDPENGTVSHEGDVSGVAQELNAAPGYVQPEQARHSTQAGDPERMAMIVSASVSQLTKTLQTIAAMELFSPSSVTEVCNNLKFMADHGDSDAAKSFDASRAKLDKLYSLSLDVSAKLLEVNSVVGEYLVTVKEAPSDTED